MKVLITVAFLDGLHGSVMHVKELSNFLANLGHEVTVVTVFYDEKIKKLFTSSKINVITVSDFEPNSEFETVFAFHFPILGALLHQGLCCKKCVMWSLSSFELLETFPTYFDKASLLVAMSEETAHNHSQSYGIPLRSIKVIENFLPCEFCKQDLGEKQSPDRLTRVIVVSNHIPNELKRAIVLLKKKKVSVDLVGGRSPQVVTPQLLLQYQVVISIGKTVQYALGLGIPVFEYDRFGGNGYITPENLNQEAKTNFSGRSTHRVLSAEEIVQTLFDDYPDASNQVNESRKLAIERFGMDVKIKGLLSCLENMPDFPNEWSPQDRLCFAQDMVLCQWMYRAKREYHKRVLNKLLKFVKRLVSKVGF